MNHHYRWIALIFAGLILNGCATAPREGAQHEAPKDLKTLCRQHNIECQWDKNDQRVTLTHEGNKAYLTIGSPLGLVNGQRIVLSAPLKSEKETAVVPADFKVKVIDRLLMSQERAVFAERFKNVAIDAGHGGKDPGTRGKKGLKEKDVVLDIAQRLKEYLEKKGINVVMTRNDDEFISLEKRTEIASQAMADIFVSIHANSSPSGRAQGWEVFYLREEKADNLKDTQRDENRQIVFKQLNMKQNDPVLEDILMDMMHTYKQGESRQVASHMARQVSHLIKTRNRGCKAAGFFVLKNTLVPAVLVEVGFLSNTKEEKLLKTASYRQKVADAIAQSILTYGDQARSQ